MIFNDEWEYSSELSSKRDSIRKNKNLRYCPGIYKPDGSYHDVWLKCWLETTPYKSFEELWKSGRVKFLFEGNVDENKRTERDL